MNATIAIIVFIIVYGLILTEKVHRAIAALLGGMLLILMGVRLKRPVLSLVPIEIDILIRECLFL
ncbi:MAG TPA: hypothetical protein VFC84_16175 [Desulfosporosinus sp.]|nr:hypothetical protein [Desulfosporosinus sp.]